MKIQIFCVKDLPANTFGQPFYAHNSSHALRSFSSTVNNVGDTNMIAKYPADFALYRMGQFDDETGKFECGDAELIVNAASVKQAQG